MGAADPLSERAVAGRVRGARAASALRWVDGVLALTLLNVLAGGCGVASLETRRLLALVGTALILLLHWPRRSVPLGWGAMARGAGLLVLALTLLAVTEQSLLWVCAVPVILCGLGELFKGLGAPPGGLQALVPGALLFALVFAVYHGNGLLWQFVQRAFFTWSGAIGRLTGTCWSSVRPSADSGSPCRFSPSWPEAGRGTRHGHGGVSVPPWWSSGPSSC
jgi:hypothetical protein